MFCPKCGTNLPENSEFCFNCGTNLKETKQVLQEENNSTETMTEMFSKNSKKFINPILDKIKQFCLKYKKTIAIGLTVCFILSLGILLFTKLYDFTKISWDMDNGDANVTHTQPTTLTLNVLAYDKQHNPIYDIEFSTDDGEIVSEGAKVDWILPEETGNYTITATAPSGKKISKSVKVIKLEEDNTYISGLVSDPVDDEVTDSDEDGLLDAEEKKLGTNIGNFQK